MESRLRLALACSGLLLAGCPRAPAPPAAASPAMPDSALASPSTPPEAGPTQVPLASPTPQPPRSGGALAPEEIPLGTQAHPWPGVNLGFERTETLGRPHQGARREERSGHLTLGLGQLFFSSDVFAGDQVRVGGGLLEVLGVEPGSLRFRWLTPPARAERPQIRPARPRLRELGLYRFEDGRVIGVGQVTTLAKRDGSAVDVVTLSLFPPGYEENPLQDYEVLPRLVVGQPLGSAPLGGRKLRLVQLQAGGAKAGWVRLAE
jgi:hypothetical protein